MGPLSHLLWVAFKSQKWQTKNNYGDNGGGAVRMLHDSHGVGRESASGEGHWQCIGGSAGVGAPRNAKHR